LATGIPARLNRAEGRRFGLTVGAAFLVLAGLMWWRDHEALRLAFGIVGLSLAAAAIVVPARLGPIQRAWMALARAISRVTTPVFMGVVYFVVIMPVGLVMRALGRNPIRHRPANGSFWVARTQARGTMSNQF
jgi:hypothetical protein